MDEYDHNHYYKAFQVKKEFVTNPDDPTTYVAKDYAYHYCSGCGETIKVEVKEDEL